MLSHKENNMPGFLQFIAWCFNVIVGCAFLFGSMKKQDVALFGLSDPLATITAFTMGVLILWYAFYIAIDWSHKDHRS